eukprot:CAMPEP_0178583892 /NCGR_PEP_ID=MMETSP0697-20121206/24509_1 /TAXON_ID=265572 /ORGANISM="Extubocellulus spinifer, Strain CCMP396" /LENGTH=81 /DNA_ID=CAMNT_0020219739 /DNA_START=45 /DNA_END=290 /DNA_ORIENTATION=-
MVRPLTTRTAVRKPRKGLKRCRNRPFRLEESAKLLWITSNIRPCTKGRHITNTNAPASNNESSFRSDDCITPGPMLIAGIQ